MISILQGHPNYSELPAQTSQQIIKSSVKSWLVLKDHDFILDIHFFWKHGVDYTGVTTSTTMSNLQEFIRDYEIAYQATVPNRAGDSIWRRLGTDSGS